MEPDILTLGCSDLPFSGHLSVSSDRRKWTRKRLQNIPYRKESHAGQPCLCILTDLCH